jgi:GDPmannose 4,6-dehydratase
MLNRTSPEDFVIATGVTQSLKEFVETVFIEAGLDWRQHVVSDAALHRPSDIMVSKGNPCKAEIQLMWKAQTIGPEVGRLMFHQSHLAT